MVLYQCPPRPREPVGHCGTLQHPCTALGTASVGSVRPRQHAHWQVLCCGVSAWRIKGTTRLVVMWFRARLLDSMAQFLSAPRMATCGWLAVCWSTVCIVCSYCALYIIVPAIVQKGLCTYSDVLLITLCSVWGRCVFSAPM